MTTTQAQLDEIIVNVKAALSAINPDYVPDYLEQKPLRNSALTYQQVDWTGEQLVIDTSEQLVIDTSERCLVCNDPLLNLRGGVFGAGRLNVYCSDACKMKAYRQRKKALRIVRHLVQQSSLPVVLCSVEQKPVLTIVGKHPLQNLAPFVNPSNPWHWKIPKAVWQLSDKEVIALGYFITQDGQILTSPLNFDKPRLPLLPPVVVKDFNDLKSFLGGVK